MPLPAAPQPARKPHRLGLHGRQRDDEFYWMRDENWQAVMRDPSVLREDIRAHLEAENAYTKALLAHTESLQETLFTEMKGRIKENDSSVPQPDGPYAYYARYETGGQHPIFCRGPREAPEENEHVLLHGDALAAGHAYFSLGDTAHSPDHSLLAYSQDTQGSEIYTIRIKLLTSGDLLDDEITGTAGDILWAPDGRAFYYRKVDDNHRPSTVWKHHLGTDQKEDRLVYKEDDPAFFVSLGETESRRYLVLHIHDHQTSEVYLIDTHAPEETLIPLAPRRSEHDYSVSHHGDWLYILTNSGDAEDFRLMRAPIATPQEAHWEEIIAHRPGCLLLDMVLFEGHMVRLERENGLPRIVIAPLHTDGTLGSEQMIDFPEQAYALGLTPGFEFASTVLRFVYASPTTPQQTFDYDMVTGQRVLRKTQDVPSGHDPARYVTRRFLAPAPDGEQIPVTVLHRADLDRDGTAPLLLYGYGSYGISIPAGFSTTRLSLVDRGVVYAIAHIRGGKDKGYGWYRAGKGFTKIHTFTDFIAAGEALITEGYTSRGRLIAHGGSAGGLLVGASVNMAPDLFGGVIAEVPFVDVLTTICDDTLPLTPPEWTEWGNPITDKNIYEYIASYSPYDNISTQTYPAILATAGLSDPRVTYWEPAKWVARLRERRTDDGQTLLWTYMDAGHAGAAGRFDQLRETAFVYAFALDVMGLAETV